MSRTAKRWVVFGVVLAVVVAVGLAIGIKVVAPRVVQRELIARVAAGCESCQLTIESTAVELFPTAVLLHNATFHSGTPHATAVVARVKQLHVPVALWALRRGQIRLGAVLAEGLVVDVTEGPGQTPPSHGAQPDLEVESLTVHDGGFSYTNDHDRRRGTLRVHAIEAGIGPLGTTPQLRDEIVRGEAKARLEKSGHVRLVVTARLFHELPHVDVDLHLDGQNLADTNHLFEPLAGVHLQGTLLRSHGKASVHGHHLRAEVEATYRDLDLHMETMPDRGALATALQNFVAAWKIAESNTDKERSDRVRSIERERKPDETLVACLLHGLQEAAMAVTAK